MPVPLAELLLKLSILFADQSLKSGDPASLLTPVLGIGFTEFGVAGAKCWDAWDVILSTAFAL